MKNQINLFLLLLMGGFAAAQEKAPIITDDHASIMAGDTISINVMANDWGMDGHTISILNVYQGLAGHAVFQDSSITYSSSFSSEGIDTVRYVLQDEDNGMLSDAGHLVLSISNEGRDIIDVNNYKAFIQSFGPQFCDMSGGFYKPVFEIPKGSKRNSIFIFNLWLGGLDANNELHLAAERYRSTGNDLWNGPVSSTYVNQQILDYNKVWKFNREDIESHRQHWWEPDYLASDAIASWPAHGDEDLGQAGNLATFNDRNDDGAYEYDDGDYPAIRGDQGLFFIYNDDFGEHTESGGEKIKAEVHGQAYAYDCPNDSTFYNTLFFHYDIISRSELSYHEFYLAAHLDFDLGNAWDDYAGCDTLLNAVFAYNGDDYDESDSTFGYPATWGYHETPPAQAMVFLNVPLNSAISFSNYGGISGDPNSAEEIYNTMQGLWKNGTAVTLGGNGTGGDVTTKYLYSGNPSTPGEWSEYSEENNPSDRRSIAAAGPFDLNTGDTLQLDIAFVFARDYNGSQTGSVDLLKERIAELQWYYDNDSTPCGKAWTGNQEAKDLVTHFKVYPNPSSQKVNVITEQLNSEYLIYDMMGRIVQQGFLLHLENVLDVTGLTKGVHFLSIQAAGKTESCKLIIY